MPSYFDILIAFIIVLAACLISFYKKHEIEKELFIAAIRSFLQISFLGMALKWIFSNPSIWISLIIATFMTISSALHSRGRVKSKYPGLLLDSLFSTALSIWPLALLGSFLLKSNPWWQADLFLPLIGMLLGNAMNGISLGMDQFTHEVKVQKDEILSYISLGATVPEATEKLLKRCLRVSLTPMMNAMATMGLVSIPGMMTGQILGGQPPEEAAIIQIIMMLLIASGVYFGTLIGLHKARRRLFDDRGIPCF